MPNLCLICLRCIQRHVFLHRNSTSETASRCTKKCFLHGGKRLWVQLFVKHCFPLCFDPFGCFSFPFGKMSSVLFVLLVSVLAIAVESSASCQSFPVLTDPAVAATFMCYGIVDYEYYVPDGVTAGMSFVFSVYVHIFAV